MAGMGYKRRKQRALFFAMCIFIGVALLVAGCSHNRMGSEEEAFFTVVDDSQRTVVIKHLPQRIVSLAPSHTETLFALGLDTKIVGVTTYCDFPPQAQSKEKVGGFSDPSLEKILALHPDLVVGTDLHVTVAEELERAGIPVLIFHPHNVEETLHCITLIGKATGAEDAAALLVEAINRQVNEVVEKVSKASEKPRVYYEIWHDPLMTAGPGTVIDDLIRLAGGINVAADAATPYPTYSQEVLLKKNPQIMLHSYGHGSQANIGLEEIRKRSGWEKMECVQTGRIYSLDANLITRPGPRIGEGLQEIARIIHPELFK